MLKRVPERRSSLEEREAMRRLRHQRKRIPNSTGLHDELEDKVHSPTGGGNRRKRTPKTAPLAAISDDKRLIEDSATPHNLEFAKEGLLGRRRKKREPHVKEDKIMMAHPTRKRINLPTLSEEAPLAGNSLAADTRSLRSSDSASKYSYAKSFLLGKRDPMNMKSKRKGGKSDPVAAKIESILDEARVPKAKKQLILPKLMTYVNSLLAADRNTPSRKNLKEDRKDINQLKDSPDDTSPEEKDPPVHTGV